MSDIARRTLILVLAVVAFAAIWTLPHEPMCDRLTALPWLKCAN